MDTKIEIKSGNEIGQLAESFSEMTKQLAVYTKELENKVAERTQELDKKLKELIESNQDLGETQGAMVNLVEDARVLEKSLKEERDRVEAIITSMGEGLIVVDKKIKLFL